LGGITLKGLFRARNERFTLLIPCQTGKSVPRPAALAPPRIPDNANARWYDDAWCPALPSSAFGDQARCDWHGSQCDVAQDQARQVAAQAL